MSHKPDEEGSVDALDESDEFPDETVTFKDEDGVEHECVVLAVVEVEGQDYAMLAAADQMHDDDEDNEVETYVFEYSVDDEGFEHFAFIEDEARYQRVVQVCATLMAEGDDDEDAKDA
jgi:uncharacterized protein YrzB (UPF0473 family)